MAKMLGRRDNVAVALAVGAWVLVAASNVVDARTAIAADGTTQPLLAGILGLLIYAAEIIAALCAFGLSLRLWRATNRSRSVVVALSSSGVLLSLHAFFAGRYLLQ
jgi:hypothetical protein